MVDERELEAGEGILKGREGRCGGYCGCHDMGQLGRAVVAAESGAKER